MIECNKIGGIEMKFTRMFFEGIAHTFATTMTMLFVLLMSLIAIFVVYYYTGYIMNPLLPIGLIIIWAVFRKGGAIELIMDKEEEERKNLELENKEEN